MHDVHDVDAALSRPADVTGAIRDIARRELAPLVAAIDREGHYPEAVLRAFGAAGAFAAHGEAVANGDPGLGLRTAIEAMSVASEYCLSTAFCMWCQDALAWYISASSNAGLQFSLGPRVARASGGHPPIARHPATRAMRREAD